MSQEDTPKGQFHFAITATVEPDGNYTEVMVRHSDKVSVSDSFRKWMSKLSSGEPIKPLWPEP
jgi:hypothetical protein